MWTEIKFIEKYEDPAGDGNGGAFGRTPAAAD